MGAKIRLARLTGLAAALVCSLAQAAEETPTPPLREMITDAFVETPHTVDKGHVQIELSLLDITYDRDTRTTSLLFAPLLLKAGIGGSAEAQLLLFPYGRVRTESSPAGKANLQAGFGDLTIRLKVNLLGNDAGAFALAVVSFAHLPTRGALANEAALGGLAIPLSLDLTDQASAGTTTRIDLLKESGDTHAEFSHATGAYYDIADWEGYTELFLRFGPAPLVLALNLGVIYFVKDDLQLDAELVLGLTEEADDINSFFGASWRF